MGLARIVNEKGNGDLAMLMGLGVVGASYTNKSQAKLTETTPIVRLIEEYGAIMVSKDSPYKTIDDLVDRVEGGPRLHQRRRRLLARRPRPPAADAAGQAVGIDPRKVNFVSVRRRRRPASGHPRQQARLGRVGGR